jgi:hypothetical protein
MCRSGRNDADWPVRDRAAKGEAAAEDGHRFEQDRVAAQV